MPQRLRSLLFALPALLLAACAAGAPASPSASPAAATTPPAATSPSSPAGSPGAIPSFNADPALEAQLPNQIDGKTLQKLSFRGDTFAQVGGEDNELTALLQRLGTSAQNLSLAVAVDPTGGVSAQLFAIRLAGTDANRVIQELINAAKSNNANVGVQQSTVGGKSVTTVTDPTDEDGVVYVYARGDVVFGTQTTDPATADKILRALP